MKRADKFCAADQLREKNDHFESKIIKSVRRGLPRPSEKMKLDFLALLGKQYARSDIFCSDLTARQEAGAMFVNEFSKMWGQTIERTTRGEPPTYFAFATFIHKEWNCSDRAAAFNIQAIRNKVARAIRQSGLDGVAVIEIQPLGNYPEQGKGRSLMANVHALVWARQAIDTAAWKRSVNGSLAWPTDFGCAALEAKLLGEDTLENRLNIERALTYMVKPPCDSKIWKPQKDQSDRYKFVSSMTGYPPNLALRTFECLSHLRLLDVVFGIGKEGVKWCNRWRTQVRGWKQRRFQEEVLRDVDPIKFWAKYRKKTGTHKFSPVQMLTGAERGAGLAYRGGDNDPAQPLRAAPAALRQSGNSHRAQRKKHKPQRRSGRKGSYERLLKLTQLRR